jgi:hypothetical protein
MSAILAHSQGALSLLPAAGERAAQDRDRTARLEAPSHRRLASSRRHATWARCLAARSQTTGCGDSSFPACLALAYLIEAVNRRHSAAETASTAPSRSVVSRTTMVRAGWLLATSTHAPPLPEL